MKRALGAALLGAALLSFGACAKDAPAPHDRDAAHADSAAAAAADSSIPTEEDYEASAEKKITPDNANAELDALDKEIGR